MLESRKDEIVSAVGFDRQVRPLKAFIAGVRFLVNVEETHQFFAVTDAIDGPQNERNYQRYLKTETGARLDAEGVDFTELFSDKTYLGSFPSTSLASAYLEFLARENLDLDILMGAEEDAGVISLQLDRSRRNFIAAGTANHDLLHVLTQYGREPLGEALLLAFTGEQFNLRGVGLIAHALGMREQVTHPRLPIIAMLGEAKRLAREAQWLPEIDWREEFALPVEDVRGRIGLGSPEIYLRHSDTVTTTQGPQALSNAA